MTDATPAPWWFEDFAVGQRFTSQARTLTEADVAWFAGWSWDTNPVHTDLPGTLDQRFGGPVAHGVLGISVAMGLLSRIGVFERCSVALLGIDAWRFRAPLRAGDTVRAEVTITALRRTSAGDTGVLDRHVRLLCEDGEVAQEGDIALLVAGRPAAAR